MAEEELVMKTEKTANRFEFLISVSQLSLVSAIVYLFFIRQFSYFNDDWYLMYAAGARGPSVFWDIFSVDRPLRALVMIPAYTLFGASPFYYNLSAFLFRLIGGFSFLWILRMLWPENRRVTLWMALLFLTYPGFLSQPNAIDYLCHLTGLAAGMLSIVLTIKAIRTGTGSEKSLLYVASVVFGWFYLGQIEWFIGLEFLRFACVLLLSNRSKGTIWEMLVRFFRWAFPVFFIPGVFLTWRLFFFNSERGATDVDLQFTGVLEAPITFILKLLSTLLDDILDVLIRAWGTPLKRLSYEINSQEWVTGVGITLLILATLWTAYRASRKPEESESSKRSGWRREAIWIGLGLLVFGLLPVILVGRTVDFKNFSRYTLIASAGAAVLWPLGLSYISNVKLQNIFFGILIVSASLTHYANGLMHARDTKAMRDFWWQVSWRIPQLEPGTTLVTYYSVAAEEDYFTWGPANLIYYPESAHKDYVQPTIYAALLNDETVSKVLARTRQEYSNRRSIVVYPNYRNILILTQPTPDSCVHVMDFNQLELSAAEDARVATMAPYSEPEHILLGESFHTPPVIPFGDEPSYGWCYYYQKASYARQMGDWNEVVLLGEETHALGLFADDPIEWMPFLQAYAYFDNTARMEEIASFLTSDRLVAQQACQTLTGMPLTPSTLEMADKLFCPGK